MRMTRSHSPRARRQLKDGVHDVLLWLRNTGWGQYEEMFAVNQVRRPWPPPQPATAVPRWLARPGPASPPQTEQGRRPGCRARASTGQETMAVGRVVVPPGSGSARRPPQPPPGPLKPKAEGLLSCDENAEPESG